MNRRLTEEQAQSIVDRVAAGELQKKLAAEFNVTTSTISNLIRGRSWPDMDRPDPPDVTVRGAKLRPEDIPIILTRIINGEKPADIAPDYKVTRQAIADIKWGKTWTHIPRPVPNQHQRRRVWERT